MDKTILHYNYKNDDEIVKNAVCYHCGKIHIWNEYNCAVYQGKYICEDCYQKYYGYCNNCMVLYKYADMNDEIMCLRCENARNE